MNLQQADKLSEAARGLLLERATAYGRLVVSDGDAASSPARPRVKAIARDGLLARPVASPEQGEALLAGWWLWHDFLDESHAISQHLESPTGSFWHAIMHRREGDFSNAKYWYARCRNHAVIGAVAEAAGESWDPNTFVDLVERVHDRGGDDARHAKAVRLQRLEWAALFTHCLREVDVR
jgi:hypothetical protein